MSQNTAIAFAAQKNITHKTEYKTESEEFPKFKAPRLRGNFFKNEALVGLVHTQHIRDGLTYNASCVNENTAGSRYQPE